MLSKLYLLCSVFMLVSSLQSQSQDSLSFLEDSDLSESVAQIIEANQTLFVTLDQLYEASEESFDRISSAFIFGDYDTVVDEIQELSDAYEPAVEAFENSEYYEDYENYVLAPVNAINYGFSDFSAPGIVVVDDSLLQPVEENPEGITGNGDSDTSQQSSDGGTDNQQNDEDSSEAESLNDDSSSQGPSEENVTGDLEFLEISQGDQLSSLGSSVDQIVNDNLQSTVEDENQISADQVRELVIQANQTFQNAIQQLLMSSDQSFDVLSGAITQAAQNGDQEALQQAFLNFGIE